MAKRVFILGAGFSAGAKMPLAAALTTLLLQKAADLDSPVVRVVDPGSACGGFRDRYRRVFGDKTTFIKERMEDHDWT